MSITYLKKLTLLINYTFQMFKKSMFSNREAGYDSCKIDLTTDDAKDRVWCQSHS